MDKKALPSWPEDELSANYFRQAQHNERATSLNYPDVYELIGEANQLFESASKAVEHYSGQNMLLPRFFVVRTRAAFLAAVHLAMAGHLPESSPVLRLSIELAWYALHIAKDPKPPRRATIWLKRGSTAADTQACKAEFTIKNVRATHETVDPVLSNHLHQLYQDVIELGAHPNQLGLFSSMQSEESESTLTYQVGILFPQEYPLLTTVGMALAVAHDVLRTFQSIFPERFEIMSLDTEIADFLNLTQKVFQNYGFGPKV